MQVDRPAEAHLLHLCRGPLQSNTRYRRRQLITTPPLVKSVHIGSPNCKSSYLDADAFLAASAPSIRLDRPIT